MSDDRARWGRTDQGWGADAPRAHMIDDDHASHCGPRRYTVSPFIEGTADEVELLGWQCCSRCADAWHREHAGQEWSEDERRARLLRRQAELADQLRDVTWQIEGPSEAAREAIRRTFGGDA